MLASTLLVELGAIAYHARWVPFVRTEVMQEISKIDSAIANRLGAASRYEDQQLSQTKPQSAPLISPIPAEKIFTGPIIETTYEKLSSAAAKGLASAQYHLGLRYAAGAGVPQDETRAAEWFQKAANQGHPGAQRALSELYLRGEGVPKDIVRAYTWASIAMLAQSYPSPELKSIESQMTAHQIRTLKGESRPGRNRRQRRAASSHGPHATVGFGARHFPGPSHAHGTLPLSASSKTTNQRQIREAVTRTSCLGHVAVTKNPGIRNVVFVPQTAAQLYQ